jgi:predicted tellurium resistance membrane protein TerC
LDFLTDLNSWAALATLTALEVVLGIDNVVFISILVSRVPEAQAARARKIGLSLALVFRIALLFSLTSLMRLTDVVVTVFHLPLSWRNIILIAGGLFLIGKATHEIHSEIEVEPNDDAASGGAAAGRAFALIVVQLILIDIVFSIDSIVTAIGMSDDIEIMVMAVIIAVGVMYVASGPVAGFIARHPTTKMLALAFLLLIGIALIADGLAFHIPRGYIYFAMAFAALVEAFNVWARRNRGRPRV